MIQFCVLIAVAFHAPNLPPSLVRPLTVPINVPINDGGVYDVATHALSAPGIGARLGSDVVYNNTCDEQFYESLGPGESWTDEGRLPSLTSPDTISSKPGCASEYRIDGFRIGYCTTEPVFDAVISFYSNYATCSPPSSNTPVATFFLPGLPAATVPGTLSCWSVDIDLGALGFTMPSDGDGAYDGGTLDRFGWTFAITSATTYSNGLIKATDPSGCFSWSGTIWDPLGQSHATRGNGMGTVNGAYLDSPGTGASGCYFGSAIYYSYYLRLYSRACPLSGPGVGFCFGDGSGLTCPCMNFGQAFNGCSNSVDLDGSRLAASGVSSLSMDTLTLLGSSMPNSTALYFQGTSRLNNGLGVPLGDGLRCAGGSVLRLGIRTNASGSSMFPAPGAATISTIGQISSPSIRTYQVWYRNSAPYCTSAPFNLTNGYEVSWSL